MTDLHLEMARLYYPDSWGASVEHWVMMQQREHAREYEARKTPEHRAKARVWEAKYRASPEYNAKRRAYKARRRNARLASGTG